MVTSTDLSPSQKHGLDTILRRPLRGIGVWQINPMEWRMIDRLAGVPEGTYREHPIETYRRMLTRSGCLMLDQWIPDNPLSIRDYGFEGGGRTPTTAQPEVVCDGLRIDSPEAVVEHLERLEFPRLEQAAAGFDETAYAAELIEHEKGIQDLLGREILKAPYGDPFGRFPGFAYGAYGYVPYFSAYALYPEVMERHFRLCADLCVKQNEIAAIVIREYGLPPYVRLDHDMADSRGTLVDIRSLDRIWFPEFARSIVPLVEAGVTCVWHCDGNLMQMAPRLIEAGVAGFQGFQYEHGMDYERICRMRTRGGDSLLIIAGVSVTRTLPLGTPQDVRDEMRWLVETGPAHGLFLGCSSSITPGVPWRNLEALVEGFRHYREHGRG